MRTALGSLAFLLLTLAPVALADPPVADTRDSYQQGLDAFAQKRYRIAVRQLDAFVKSSIGDPRTEKAAKVLHDARLAFLQECLQTGRAVEAAGLYMALAQESATPKETKEGYIKKTSQLLTSALADAQKKRAWDTVLDIHAAWKKHLPDQPAPITDEQAAEAKMDLLIALCEENFNKLTMPDLTWRLYPGEQPPWDDIAKRNRGVPLSLSYFKTLADLGWTGRYIADIEHLRENSPLRTDKTFAAQTEKMFIKRAEAFALQGNIPETRKALAAARSVVTSAPGQASLKAIESKLPPDVGDALKGPTGGATAGPKLRDIAFTEPVKGKVVWADKGEGFGEAKDVLLDENAEVTIAPGTVINGGKITLKRDKIKLAGELNRPVILRNLNILVQIGGEFEARNAIFENCTFDYESILKVVQSNATRYTFNECIVYRCRFRQLYRGITALKISNSAFVESQLPYRFAKMNETVVGRADELENNQANLYLRCQVDLTYLWLSRNSNFVSCSIPPHDFVTKHSFNIPLYIPPGDPLAILLPANSPQTTTGQIQFQFSRKPFETRTPPQPLGPPPH